MIKYFLFIFLFVAVSYSNNHKKIRSITLNNNVMNKVYPVDPKAGKTIYASSVFDSIAYLTLPFDEITTIGSIDKIEVYNSKYYFWDKIGRKIWCYDNRGNYIFKLDKRGQGPGEYTQIYDFNIDKEHQQIQILDRNLRKILCYDLNGNYIKDVKLEVAASQFAVLQNGFLLHTGGMDIFMGKDKNLFRYNLFISDSEGNVERRYCPYKEFLDDYVGFKVFSIHEEKKFYRYARNDTIYEFDDAGNLACKFLFDFGKYRIPNNINNKEMASRYLNNPNIAFVFETFHTQQHMFVSYGFANKFRFLLMDKKNETILNGSFLENDIDGISFAYSPPIYAWEDKLIFVREASEIIAQKKDGKSIYKSIPQLMRIQEDDNPIIIIAYLKKK